MTDTARHDAIAEHISRVEEMYFLPEMVEEMPENTEPSTVLMMRNDMAIMLGMLKALHMLHLSRGKHGVT